MAIAQPWKDKWKSINSKFDTCIFECITHYHSDDKCKDSIENVIADIWSLKDWLFEDPNTRVTEADINALLKTGKSNHINACGDIETKRKHCRVKNPHRESTELILVGKHDHPSGLPVIFSVTRKYKNSSSEDIYEDACELARRAIEEWKKFLGEKGLI